MLRERTRGELEHARDRLTPRRVRLLACACARRSWRLLRAEASRRAVMIAERFADGHAQVDRLATAHQDAQLAVGRHGGEPEAAAATVAALACAPELHGRTMIGMLGSALADLAQVPGGSTIASVRSALADLMPPALYSLTYQYTHLPEHWRTPDVLVLARRAYEDREADAVGVLGDALEDAGCSWPELLDHCRLVGGHIRGCWVLDLILGRETC